MQTTNVPPRRGITAQNAAAAIKRNLRPAAAAAGETTGLTYPADQTDPGRRQSSALPAKQSAHGTESPAGAMTVTKSPANFPSPDAVPDAQENSHAQYA